jgi:hypothetical protein
VHLNQYDLFHGHLFSDHQLQRPGILFHAKEYPAFHPEHFPVNLGYCQAGSTVHFSEHGMDFRNILFYEVCSTAQLRRPCCLIRRAWTLSTQGMKEIPP